MQYTKFEIKNFKGIKELTIELDRLRSAGSGQIYTLVGLNESGKTTILEALSFFGRDRPGLSSLYGSTLSTTDVQNLIPKSRKASFDGTILVDAHILLDDGDKVALENLVRNEFAGVIDLGRFEDPIRVSRQYKFEKSRNTETKNLWTISIRLRKGRQKKFISYAPTSDEWQKIVRFISDRIPYIYFFPTFIFDIPEKIYLEPADSEPAIQQHFRQIMHDVLFTIDADLTIEDHIIKRMKSPDDGFNFFNPASWFGSSTKDAVDHTVLKIQERIADTVFKRWDQIFSKKVNDRRLKVGCHVEPSAETPNDVTKGRVFLDFSIQEGTEIFSLRERSLGFRWFFCFLLFTQFRGSRKNDQSALFLFDEPASNLHSRAQQKLLESFPLIADNQRSIIYSTHSHYMINPKWLENTFIVSNAAVDYEDIDEAVSGNLSRVQIEVQPYRQFVNANPSRTTYFQPILESVPELIVIERCAGRGS